MRPNLTRPSRFRITHLDNNSQQFVRLILEKRVHGFCVSGRYEKKQHAMFRNIFNTSYDYAYLHCVQWPHYWQLANILLTF